MDILIAEDEQDVALTYMKSLQERGHNVTVTNNGQECLDVYNDKERRVDANNDSSLTPFDAIILDHKMPKKNGFQVAKEILSINPNQRIIIASAYDKDVFKEAAKYFQIHLEVLQKPFSIDSLVGLVESSNKG